MKLRRIKIENFRQIASWEHSFLDSIGRVRDVTLLVGPNGSGKTSILDAIACAFSTLTRINAVRPGLRQTLQRIVRHGAIRARVELEVEFTADERAVAVEVARLAGTSDPGDEHAIREKSIAVATWTFGGVDSRETSKGLASATFEGDDAYEARWDIARLLATRRLTDPGWLDRAGGVFTFDQQRSLLGRKIPRAIWELLANSEAQPNFPFPDGPNGEERHSTDPRTVLLAMALEATLPPATGVNRPSDFGRVKEAYAKVCHPHVIKGAVRGEFERFDIEFNNGHTPYRYDDLSSGEQMVLLVLLRMVSERIHHSIVLFDEIELHQHPIWQRRLLDVIERVGIGNQIIATTHSNYLRDVIPPQAVIELSDLGDRPARRVEQ
jgi:hypothetical protein